jgi:hypothetical protein
MLPKTGVYSLPDFKVIGFQRILQDYFKKLEQDQKYILAERAMGKFKEIGLIELNRQIRQMQRR